MVSPLFTIVTSVSLFISANSTFWYRNTFSVLHDLSSGTEASFSVVLNVESFVGLVVAAALANVSSTSLVFHVGSTSSEWTEVRCSPADALAGASASLSVASEYGTSWPV
jgi:hypothetical protein